MDIPNYSESISLNDINIDHLKLAPNTDVNEKSPLLVVKNNSHDKKQKTKNYINFIKTIDKKVLYDKESTSIFKKFVIKKKIKKLFY